MLRFSTVSAATGQIRRSFKPWLEQFFDRRAASWADQASPHLLLGHDHERRHGLYAKAFDQLRLLVYLQPVEAEGVVVLSPLQHLRKVALYVTTEARAPAVEEDKAGLRVLSGQS
jgi:hypothetical protein